MRNLPPPPPLQAISAADLHFVHMDETLVVVEKPAGLLSVPGRGEAGLVNLAAMVQARVPDSLVVHRLDMSTSGLMLFARGLAAQRALGLAFEKRRVDKQYVAVVQGRVAADEGTIDAALRLDWPNRPRQVVDAHDGKKSLTRWRVLDRADADDAAATTRLLLMPVTGRSHQLRVHLAHIGHPIVGDELYGEPGPRLLLHASRLAFAHPGQGAPVVFESPVPF